MFPQKIINVKFNFKSFFFVCFNLSVGFYLIAWSINKCATHVLPGVGGEGWLVVASAAVRIVVSATFSSATAATTTISTVLGLVVNHVCDHVTGLLDAVWLTRQCDVVQTVVVQLFVFREGKKNATLKLGEYYKMVDWDSPILMYTRHLYWISLIFEPPRPTINLTLSGSTSMISLGAFGSYWRRKPI